MYASGLGAHVKETTAPSPYRIVIYIKNLVAYAFRNLTASLALPGDLRFNSRKSLVLH